MNAATPSGVGAANVPTPPTPSAGPTEAQLDAERRALLGDSRSVDALDGPALQRFIAICGTLRAMKRARGEVAPKPGKANRKAQIALVDL